VRLIKINTTIVRLWFSLFFCIIFIVFYTILFCSAPLSSTISGTKQMTVIVILVRNLVTFP